jgi:hypothetical protein
MTYARLDGLNLSYEDLGRRDGPSRSESRSG